MLKQELICFQCEESSSNQAVNNDVNSKNNHVPSKNLLNNAEVISDQDIPSLNNEIQCSSTNTVDNLNLLNNNSQNIEKPTDYDEVFNTSDSDDDVHKVFDKPVLCRARASLPVKFLYFQTIPNRKNQSGYTGVFAKIDLPRRTQFGPMEGNTVDIEPNKNNEEAIDNYRLELLIDFNGTFKRLDVSNNYLSNWMRYVRPAKNIKEQNLILYQSRSNLYFSTTRKVAAKEELKVWYSSSYASFRNLELFPGRPVIAKKTSYLLSGSPQSSEWCCSHCQSSFKSATLLNLHVLTHAADNIETTLDNFENNVKNETEIDEMTKETDQKEELEFIIDSFKEDLDDLPKINGKQTFYCKVCSKPFYSKKSMDAHFKYHESNIFECPICKSKFLKLLYLKEHIHTHSENGVYSCPHCSKNFPTYKHIRNHIRTYHSGKKFICSECPKFFPTSDKLRIHLLSHSNRKEFLCANCGKQFKRKDKLTDHMKKFHLNGNDKSNTKEEETARKKYVPLNKNEININPTEFQHYIYKCHKCVIGFKRRGMLVNHLANRHPDIPPESIPELNLPILKANKDYFCQYCDKIYKSSSKRKSHILKCHPGEKLPISCREAMNDKGLSGEINGTYSQTVGSFTINPHGCEWCHKQYASKAKLLQHQRKKHNDKLPKELQYPKKPSIANYEDEIEIEKVTDSEILLFQDPMDSNISDGEFIIDANTLKRAIKGEVFIADCSPETLAELGQMIDNRPDQYFKVYQTCNGITFARPVEVWDPLSTCQTLSPSNSSSPTMNELKLS